jgi:hypothetical protein
MKPAERAAHQRLNAERAARGLRPVRRGRVQASPLPRRTVSRAEYAAYIRSPEWQAVKARYRASRLPQDCYCCGGRGEHFHHRTYKNLGAEYLRDIVPLCKDCHWRVHDIARELEAKSPGSLHLWGATNIVRRERHPRYGHPDTPADSGRIASPRTGR